MAVLLQDLMQEEIPISNIISTEPKMPIDTNRGILSTLGQNFRNNGYTTSGAIRDILSGLANSKADTWGGMLSEGVGMPFKTKQLKNQYQALGYKMPDGLSYEQLQQYPTLLKSSLDLKKLQKEYDILNKYGDKKAENELKYEEARANYYNNMPTGSGMFGGSKNAFLTAVDFINSEKFAELDPQQQKYMLDWVKNQAKNPGALYNQNYASQSGKNQSDLEYGEPIKYAETTGKLKGELGLGGAVKFEEESAKNKAKDTEAYNSMSSKLPQLEETVNVLRDLSKTATYTKAGIAADTVMRELGLPVSNNAVARTQYEAIINNQILPLLRDTFGAQFTEREGVELRKSLGDVNKSPSEKQAVLDAFIKQKKYDVQALGNKIKSYKAPSMKSGVIRMKAPNGKIYNVPANRKNEYIKAGGVQL